jgi:hypothetical protein
MHPPWRVTRLEWERRRRDRQAGRHPLGGLVGGARERLQVGAEQPRAVQPRAALDEQRAGAGDVAVGEMLPGDRDLDQALQRLSRVTRRRRPGRLQHLVHFEVELRAEQRRRSP